MGARMWGRIRKGLKNKNILVVAIICTAICAWFISGFFKGKDKDGEAVALNGAQLNPSVHVKLSKAIETAPELVVSGISAPSKDIELRSELGAKVKYVTDKRGKSVTKGEIIVELDPKGLVEKLAEAKALVEQKKLKYTAEEKLMEKNLSSQARINQALAELESAKAQEKTREVDLGETKIRAPFEGILQDCKVEVGEFVAAGSVVGRVVALDPLVVEADVTEKYVSSIEPGMPGKAIFPNGLMKEGVLQYVSPLGDKTSRTFKIEMEVENTNSELLAGETVRLIIPRKKIEAHEVFPSTLVLDENGKLGVKVVNDEDVVEFLPVELVTADVKKAYIQGLPKKVRMIVVGQGFAEEGKPVIVIEVEDKGETASGEDFVTSETLGQ